jgi:hypothetical protein
MSEVGPTGTAELEGLAAFYVCDFSELVENFKWLDRPRLESNKTNICHFFTPSVCICCNCVVVVPE